jgi:hypothetical protein
MGGSKTKVERTGIPEARFWIGEIARASELQNWSCQLFDTYFK